MELIIAFRIYFLNGLGNIFYKSTFPGIRVVLYKFLKIHVEEALGSLLKRVQASDGFKLIVKIHISRKKIPI